MKNFPDQNQFDELEKRLREYSEQPDELVWKNIDAALRPDRTPYWLPWVDHATSVAAVLLFAFVVAGTQFEKQRDHGNITSANEKEITNSKKDFLSFQQKEEKINSPDRSAPAGSDPPDTRHLLISGKNNSRSSLGLNSKFVDSEVKDSGLIAAKMYDETAGQSTGLSVPNSSDSAITSMLTPSADSIVQKHEEVASSKRIPKRRHKYYMSVTPSLSFQRAIPVSDEIVVNDFLNSSILSGERFGFSIETGIQGYLSKRWEYYGGISFYKQNQSIKYSYQVNNQVEVESSGDKDYTVIPKTLEGSLNYEMTNLGLQAGVLYNLYGRTKALRHKIGAGLQYHHGLMESDAGEYKNSASSYISYQIFYRNEVRVGKRLSVFVQPVFTQSFIVKEKSDAPFNLKPYRAGVGFGVLYDF